MASALDSSSSGATAKGPGLGPWVLSLRTGDAVLVEASPRDRIWGIGMSASHPDATDPRKWLGENLLGFALMKARAALARR